MKNILIIVGSASLESSNLTLANFIVKSTVNMFNVTLFDRLSTLPHFVPELSDLNTPNEVVEFRNLIKDSDGVIILAPEYIFSIPSGLKNAFEWCVANTTFENKPMGLITAAASGQKGHEELQLIVKTLMGNFTQETTLLISGIKGKVSKYEIDEELQLLIQNFLMHYEILVN